MQNLILVLKQRRDVFWLFFYILLLHVAWAVCRILLIPYFEHIIGDPWNALVEAAFKIPLWIIPVLIYIKYVLKADILAYLKLKTQIGNGLVWGLVGCTFPLWIFCASIFIQHQSLHLSLSASVWLNTILLVGLIEEIPFRGLIFQQMQTWWGFWKASIFSSFFFTTIHLPIWIMTGQTSVADMIGRCITVFTLGLIFSYLFKRSNSLWSSILMHSVYDFVTSIF